MLKIKELLKSFIETQNQINESLKGLREDLKPKLDKITITSSRLDDVSITVNKLDDYIVSNIYTREETEEAINKEYDYREKYKECKQKNADLLHLIETYFKYEDKYEVLNIFDDIDRRYVVEKVDE